MGPANESELMPSVKLSDNILSEDEAHTSIVVCPALDVKFGVRPQQIAKETGIRHVLRSSLLVDSFQIVEIGTEATMHAQNTIIYDSCNWQNIEASSEFSPNSHVVSSFALIVKAIHSVDGLTFVVASQ